jgi:hypothetical protein
MNATYIDPVFGEMQYKHRWYKEEKIVLFDSDWMITVAAKAYSGKPITDQQRVSYKQFSDNYDEMADIIAKQIVEYINENCESLAAYWIGARTVSSAYELSQIVRPKTLLIKQDGTTMLLLDCPWEEGGIAVQVLPDVQIGPQDMFL